MNIINESYRERCGQCSKLIEFKLSETSKRFIGKSGDGRNRYAYSIKCPSCWTLIKLGNTRGYSTRSIDM
jgi:hypothetical protein